MRVDGLNVYETMLFTKYKSGNLILLGDNLDHLITLQGVEEKLFQC